jgi:hypothetical protein
MIHGRGHSLKAHLTPCPNHPTRLQGQYSGAWLHPDHPRVQPFKALMQQRQQSQQAGLAPQVPLPGRGQVLPHAQVPAPVAAPAQQLQQLATQSGAALLQQQVDNSAAQLSQRLFGTAAAAPAAFGGIPAAQLLPLLHAVSVQSAQMAAQQTAQFFMQ